MIAIAGARGCRRAGSYVRSDRLAACRAWAKSCVESRLAAGLGEPGAPQLVRDEQQHQRPGRHEDAADRRHNRSPSHGSKVAATARYGAAW